MRAPWLAWAERTLGIEAARSSPAEITAAFGRAAGAEGPHSLLRRVVGGDPAARVAVLDALLVGETYVMRHPYQFALVADELASMAGPWRLWSAGCSSGEEAWSLAIVAAQALGERALREVRVLGTDINPRSIERARAGRYRPWSLRGLDPEVRDRWFVRDGRDWVVDDRLRKITSFRELDLLAPFGPEWPRGIDVVSCRNVLLYLTPAARAAAVGSITRCMAPRGALIFAPVDPVPDLSAMVPDPRGSGLYRLAEPAPEEPEAPAPTLPPDPPVALLEDPVTRDGMEPALARAMELQAADRHEEAIAEVRLVLALAPRDPVANTLLACSLARVGEEDRAIQAAEAALRALGEEGSRAADELRFVCERVLELYRRR